MAIIVGILSNKIAAIKWFVTETPKKYDRNHCKCQTKTNPSTPMMNSASSELMKV